MKRWLIKTTATIFLGIIAMMLLGKIAPASECTSIKQELASTQRDGIALQEITDPKQVQEAARYFNQIEPITAFEITIAYIGDAPNGWGRLSIGHNGQICWRFNLPPKLWRAVKTRVLGKASENV